MPARLLRDWTCSDKMNRLPLLAEVFFGRLIMKCDDYGCFYANERLLLASLFPLKPDVTVEDIRNCLKLCTEAGMLATYEQEGKEFLQIKNFNQRLRQKTKKFPHPGAAPPSQKQTENNEPASWRQDADTMLTSGWHDDSIKRPEEEVEEKRTRREEEEELYIEPQKINNNEFFSHEKDTTVYNIENLLTQALHDAQWCKATGATRFELEVFNATLAKRFQHKLTAHEYRFYFSAMKDKYPERFKPPRSFEDIMRDAERLDKEWHEQQQNKNNE